MQMSDITEKQSLILEFIKKETELKGYPPSVREICQAVGLRSTSTVHGHLERLEKKGYIRRDATKPRAIEVLSFDKFVSQSDIINIPIVGEISAGQPILAFENIESTFPIPASYFNTNSQLFILEINGESMINAGIFDGDYVIIEKKSTASNGEIVAALIEDSATVKRFYKEENRIRLQPENPYMDPIIVNSCMILGKVVGVFRRIK